MSSPFVLVTTHRIAPGDLESFKALNEEYLDFVEQNEPQMLAHLSSCSGDGTIVSLVQVHPDAASADHHLEIAGPRILAAADLIENVGIDVYGTPGPLLQAAIAHNADAGVPVRRFDACLGGFARA
jgi:hypothetical protein